MSRAKSRKKNRNQISKLPNNSPALGNSGFQKVEISTQKVERFQGPLPHPTILQAYDLVMPGLAGKIVTAWESQTAHRIHLEDVVIEGDNKRANWGLISATSITIIVIVACTVLAVLNKSDALYAMGIIVLNLATLGGIFVYGANSRKHERERKMGNVK